MEIKDIFQQRYNQFIILWVYFDNFKTKYQCNLQLDTIFCSVILERHRRQAQPCLLAVWKTCREVYIYSKFAVITTCFKKTFKTASCPLFRELLTLPKFCVYPIFKMSVKFVPDLSLLYIFKLYTSDMPLLAWLFYLSFKSRSYVSVFRQIADFLLGGSCSSEFVYCLFDASLRHRESSRSTNLYPDQFGICSAVGFQDMYTLNWWYHKHGLDDISSKWC